MTRWVWLAATLLMTSRATADDPAVASPPLGDPLTERLGAELERAQEFEWAPAIEWRTVDTPRDLPDLDRDFDGILDQRIDEDGGARQPDRRVPWRPFDSDSSDRSQVKIAGGKEPVAEPRPTPTDEPDPTDGTPPDDLGFLDVVLVGTGDRDHCSGVLVAPAVVLTAAHCVPADRVAIGHRAQRLFARLRVTDARIHPTLDAALLRLERAVPVPVRPRRRAAMRRPPVGVVRMVGFGVDDARHPTSFGVKRRVDASISGWGCDRARARATGCRPRAELVLAAVGGGDTCYGDSGGPVLEPVDGVYRLLAITSRPTASGGAVCGRGGIYVRVDALDAWITANLEALR